MDISKKIFQQKIGSSTWASQGDSFEQRYGQMIVDSFPNLEVFWRIFIVPSTGRIHTESSFIRQPKLVDPRVVVIGNHNYVIFQHLIKCDTLIKSQDYFAIDDFYTHLVSVSDNFESLVAKLILLLSEFDGNLEPRFLTMLTKNEFLNEMEDFYENVYPQLFDNYKAKGHIPLNLRHKTQESILIQFFKKKNLKKYARFSQDIRKTRNLYVHGVRLGHIVIPNGDSLQPKHSKVSEYRDDYRKVFNVQSDKSKLNSDFVVSKDQMQKDLLEMKDILNNLYDIILGKVKNIQSDKFYKNLYDLKFI